MELIDVPVGLKGPRENGSALAVGPFAMNHNGEQSLGFFLEDQEDVWVVSDGGRDYALDSTYTVHTSGNSITFYSKRYDSKFVLRPLTQNDVAWITPDEPELEIEELKELLLDGATNQYTES